MATNDQINANRNNSKLSTGPTTPDGKATAAQNAFRHGLTAKNLLIHDHEKEDFQKFQEGHLRDLMPEGAIQWDFFDQILRCSWNLQKMDRMEKEYFEKNGMDAIFNSEDKSFDRILRYRRMLSLELRRALEELRKLQTEQALRCLPQNLAFRSISHAVNTQSILTALTKRSQNRLPNFDLPKPTPKPEEAKPAL